MFQISGGRVFAESGAPVSSLEFWNYCKSHPGEFQNLELLGVTEPELVVSVDGDRLVSHVQVRTEYGVFRVPGEMDGTWENVVVDEYWIPLEPDSTAKFFQILEANGWKHDAVPKGAFFRVSQALREAGLNARVDQEVFERLARAGAEPELTLLEGSAYEYQRVGIAWLCDYFDNGLGALLCDEMGLGKTYQALGLVAHLVQNANTPILICCPASLVANWQGEFARFLPSVDVHTHVGPHRGFSSDELQHAQVVLTTYDLVVNDSVLLDRVSWALVICDEAQALKNRDSQRHQAVSELKAGAKVLVTGTPVENSLKDLWSLSNIIAPGYLGTFRQFEALISDTPSEAQEVGRRASPFILRRNVLEVAKDLPPLVEIDEPIIPSAAFVDFYEDVRKGASNGSAKKSFLVVLNQLTQACCYPGLVDGSYADNLDAKYTRLAEILDELHELNCDKVLIFSTFTESIDRLVAFVNRRFDSDLAASLDGRLAPAMRQGLIDDFNQAPGFRCLVINPKAGGTGLNITGANHVIHFNRQWNPQLERQATARAYRRKQTKPVFVHKFFYLGTVEQVINERLRHKEELAGAALIHALAEEEQAMQARAMLISPANQEKENRWP